MIDALFTATKENMQKSIEALHHELGKLRTGRANTGLLDSIVVPYYGNDTPLNQVANISVGDARTLLVTPWEKNMGAAIEKAIRASDLGLNPASVGDLLRVPLPPLTEQRRKDLIKVVKAAGEKARVAVRNQRRDANNTIKDLQKDKSIGEDEQKRAEEKIQKITDGFIADIDKTIVAKEADLMEV